VLDRRASTRRDADRVARDRHPERVLTYILSETNFFGQHKRIKENHYVKMSGKTVLIN